MVFVDADCVLEKAFARSSIGLHECGLKLRDIEDAAVGFGDGPGYARNTSWVRGLGLLLSHVGVSGFDLDKSARVTVPPVSVLPEDMVAVFVTLDVIRTKFCRRGYEILDLFRKWALEANPVVFLAMAP